MQRVKHRFHVVALPHTRTSKEFCACAYTQKILNFCKMMRSLGNTVYHYGAEGSEADCDEHIEIISNREQDGFFGSVDWHKRNFPIQWDPNKAYWQMSNKRAAEGINARKKKGDFVCLVGGTCQRALADGVGEDQAIICEPFVGYYGVFSKYRVFESYAHQATVYGTMSSDPDGHLYDAVIPNYYDIADFELGKGHRTYLLYIGRLTRRKGIQIVLDVAKSTGLPLILAGQGVLGQTASHIDTEEGMRIQLSENCRYFGYADVVQRSQLMGGARAILMPTLFMEPFGGVAVESQLCGTPVICTDHAAFAETVEHGFSGYRCHTLEQFVWAVKNVERLAPVWEIRGRAVANWSTQHVRFMYQEYFDMLAEIWRDGWYAENPGRQNLDWLQKAYA